MVGTVPFLNHNSHRGIRQIDLLENFARQFHAIPLYLLYNDINSDGWRSFWHCCKFPEIEQLGCTLVPSWKIDRAINERGQRTFAAIHANANSRPWRCVFDCGQAEQQLKEIVTSHKQQLPYQELDPDTARTAALNWYPELLKINLHDFLNQMADPLSSEDLVNLRMEIDKSSQNSRHDRSSVEQE